MPEASIYAGLLAFSIGCGNILVIEFSIKGKLWNTDLNVESIRYFH